MRNHNLILWLDEPGDYIEEIYIFVKRLKDWLKKGDMKRASLCDDHIKGL